MFREYLCSDGCLIVAHFRKNSQAFGSALFYEIIHLNKELFVELESCVRSSEQSHFWLMSGIGTHILPVILLDIREIGDYENIGIFSIHRSARSEKCSK